MILIEGPDGSGKTTLAKMIQEAFDFPIVHSPGPVKDQAAAKERMYWQIELCKVDQLIMDRCFQISEYIYGDVFRNGAFSNREDYYNFAKVFNEYPGNIIIVSLQRFGAKKKMDGKIHFNEEEKKQLEEMAEEKKDLIWGKYMDFFFEQRAINSFKKYFYYEIENLPAIFEAIRRRHER